MASLISCSVYAGLTPRGSPSPASVRGQPRPMVAVRAASPVNVDIGKDEEIKIIQDEVVLDELEKPVTAYCRCWKSVEFPRCDGTHSKHNMITGDNVGPLYVKKE